MVKHSEQSKAQEVIAVSVEQEKKQQLSGPQNVNGANVENVHESEEKRSNAEERMAEDFQRRALDSQPVVENVVIPPLVQPAGRYVPKVLPPTDRFREKIQALLDEGRMSREQINRRIKCFMDIWGPIDLEEDDVLNIKATENTMENSVLLVRDEEGEGEQEAELDKLRSEKLTDADSWLLDAYLRQNGKMDESIVFSILSLPKDRKLFIYYIIENNYQIKDTDCTVFASQNGYVPDLTRLRASSFKLGEMKNLYRTACSKHEKISKEAKRDRETRRGLEGLPKEQAEAAQAALSAIRASILDADKAFDKYNKCSRIFFRDRKRLLNEANAKLEALKTTINDTSKGPLKDILERVLPKLSTKKEDDETPSVAKTVADHTGTTLGGMKSAGSLGTAIAAAAEVDNVILDISKAEFQAAGAVAGMVSFGMACYSTYRAIVERNDVTTGEKVMAGFDNTAKFLNSLAATGTSVTGFLSASKVGAEAALGTAAVTFGGITAGVGAVTMAVGIANASRASYQHKQAKTAGTYFEGRTEQEKMVPYNDGQRERLRGYHFAANTASIEKRLAKRKAVNATAQIGSGICASIMGGLVAGTVTAVAGTAVGLLGFAINITGRVVSWAMKRGESKKVVDEYLGLNKSAQPLIDTYKASHGGRISGKEADRIRDGLRQEMMEMCGFTSAKQFYTDIMKKYAHELYSKIHSPEVVGEERENYERLVTSLGLKVDIGAEKPKPTEAMILSKLSA